jgi:hypothetical protein
MLKSEITMLNEITMVECNDRWLNELFPEKENEEMDKIC